MLTNCIISRPFRDITDSQIVFLSPDLVLIEHSDPGAQDVKMSTNTYAMLKLEALQLDTSVLSLLPFIQQLKLKGFSPIGLMISYRHITGFGNTRGTIATEYQIPVLLHPKDAGHLQSRSFNISFENPIDHPMLQEFDIETLLFPGHT
jgi:hypothetical protein